MARTGTDTVLRKLQDFLFSPTMTALSAERGFFRWIDCVQICCYMKGLSRCFHPINLKGIWAACYYTSLSGYSSMLLSKTSQVNIVLRSLSANTRLLVTQINIKICLLGSSRGRGVFRHWSQ